jgi:hypothetical protein
MVAVLVFCWLKTYTQLKIRIIRNIDIFIDYIIIIIRRTIT